MPLEEALNALSNFNVIGTTPSSSFSQDGVIGFSMMPGANSQYGAFANFRGDGMEVEVRDSDGKYRACDYQGTEEVEGSEFNTLAVLVDNSGSMELEYPEAQFGNLCLTCPHDKGRLRVQAVHELISELFKLSADNHLAIMDFQPTYPDATTASRVLKDFTTNPNDLIEALAYIGGAEYVGTPLWDSLAEVIVETKETAEVVEAALALDGRRTSKGEEPEVKRYILVLSDGDDRDSLKENLESVIALAQANQVVVHAVGLGPAAAAFEDPRLQVSEQIATVQSLQKLADATGGFYTSVHDASALKELYGIIAHGLAKGYQVENYVCRPDGKLPQSGQKVEGRVRMGNETSTWSMIAP